MFEFSKLTDLLLAIFMLGLPMVGLSWFIFSLLFESGEIGREDDHKLISARIKELKKAGGKKTQAEPNLLYKKWMWFGSGFYGLAGLYTFVIIEIRELFGFLFNLPQAANYFADGIVEAIVEFFVNQLGNVVQAFLWWGYWPADSILIWVLIAYLGYWAGVELARRHKLQSVGDLRQRIYKLLPRRGN